MKQAVGRILRASDGRQFQLGAITLTFKDAGVSDGGDYSVCATQSPPGSGASPHRHSTYEEWHIILEGNYECILDGGVSTLAPGDMVYAPRGSMHGFRNLGPSLGRQLLISSPAGVFERFVEDVVNAGVDSGNPSSGAAVDFRTIAARHGIEFVQVDRPEGEA